MPSFLYVVHLAGGFFIIIVAETRHRGHVILILALGTSFVRHILVGVFLDILCKGPPSQYIICTLPILFQPEILLWHIAYL